MKRTEIDFHLVFFESFRKDETVYYQTWLPIKRFLPFLRETVDQIDQIECYNIQLIHSHSERRNVKSPVTRVGAIRFDILGRKIETSCFKLDRIKSQLAYSV